MTTRQLASLRRPRVQAVSRRAFVTTAAGALVAGAAVANGVWRPLTAHEHDPANPVPIPIGSFGFHVNAPGLPGLDPVDADPSSITDFHGFTGLAYISGMVVRTNRKTHETVELPFLVSDMRFMDGEYRGFDGRVRRGTFGFI
jgi:hypothetical protein